MIYEYEVEVSEQADNDLRGIFEYIAFELQSPANASGQLDRLEEQILSLGTMPERYRKYEKEPWKSRGLRVLPVDNYVVYYIADNDKKVVKILRIMSAAPSCNRYCFNCVHNSTLSFQASPLIKHHLAVQEW